MGFNSGFKGLRKECIITGLLISHFKDVSSETIRMSDGYIHTVRADSGHTALGRHVAVADGK